MVDYFFHKIVSAVCSGIVIVIFSLATQALESLADIRNFELSMFSVGEVEAKFDVQGAAPHSLLAVP